MAAQLLRNLLSAVAYMHANRVVHCDIKPENILLAHALPQSRPDIKNNPRLMTAIKVADFGFARVVGDRDSLTRCCGTPYYVAPEVLRCGYYRDGPAYGKGCDVWSVGVLGFVILTGVPPFQAQKQKDLFASIVKGKWSFPKSCALSDQGRDFFRRLLVPDPRARVTAAEALQHPWIHDKCASNTTHLPAVQAAVASFRQSLEITSRHSKHNASWVYKDCAAANRGQQRAPAAPKPPLATELMGGKRRERKLVVQRKDLRADVRSVLGILQSHPSVTQLDLSQDSWCPETAKKILQVLDGTPSIRAVEVAHGTLVQPSQLKSIESIVAVNRSATDPSHEAASGILPPLPAPLRCAS